jgi:hypothetical protein
MRLVHDPNCEGEQINTYERLYSINHENRGHILISIFKKSAAKNPREAERRAKQEEKRQKAQTRGESAIK